MDSEECKDQKGPAGTLVVNGRSVTVSLIQNVVECKKRNSLKCWCRRTVPIAGVTLEHVGKQGD